ncbi:DNA mismatch repair protein MutS [Chitinophaga sp. XS-30]|uniref:MutS-related protein n=1 Tax=Chitinophaga sp. XS-30 TaxID=2604421 RepID=UPI0011DE4164|nr:DNA mismatch repair protein MutS [Chitinophaga sp. XS-30]QEH39517.1 DNA mismatch repair protein MutS [Chitinophaga sp. XS-30]
MELDKTTYLDLSIFNRDDEYSLFHKLDFTTTSGGREYLRKLFSTPLQDIQAIHNRQQMLRYLLEKETQWPPMISNGSIVVVENYLNAEIEPISSSGGISLYLNAVVTKTIYAPDYGFIKFSFDQLLNLIKGFKYLETHFNSDDAPVTLKLLLDRARVLLAQKEFDDIVELQENGRFSFVEILRYDRLIRRKHRKVLWELTELYTRLDAYHSMAMAIRHFSLQFPAFTDDNKPHIAIQQLYHMILPQPVAYDIAMDPHKHFLFLTGANMAGKTTFIKAVGIAVFLAHLGMGVPAKSMQLTFFHGILSNIDVKDNIFKGESYFYSEVQRIKNTIIKISDGKNWLILIDEMFKGTNVEDAKNCSLAVINGLLHNHNCLYILSTHLYEIADELQGEDQIIFKYFQSEVIDDNLQFTYELKDGIAKEKIGFLILKKEKVIELLEKMK